MNDADQTSIIYSFKDKWRRPLEDGEISVFFRKRPPRVTCKRVYFYVGNPTSSIIGWAPIERIEVLNTEIALDLCHQGGIDRDELRKYLNNSSEVGAIFISNPHIYKAPLSTAELRRIFNFHPPQNFVKIPLNACKMMESFE